MSDKKKKNGNFTVKPQSLSKTPTQIKGLDEVLHGGIPTGRLTIINGGPGAGKTVLGMELLLRSIESGHSAVFVSFEETAEAMRRNAMSMGWDLSRYEKSGNLALLNPQIDYKAISSGTFDITGLCGILEGQVRQIGAEIIVIDAIDMLLRLFEDSAEAQNQLIILHRWINEQALTTIMTVKVTDTTDREFDYMDYMADCVISLDQRIDDQITTRRLKVSKYRGSDFASREHPFIITDQGVVVLPLSRVKLVEKTIGEFVSTNDEKLDAILGNGYRRGSSILISGPSGSGKTTLACKLTTAAAARGERTLYLSFEQSEIALISEMKSVGYDLESLIKKGSLRISSIMPESMTMEEHLHRIIQEIEEFQPEHLVLDAITATKRIGSNRAAREFLIRLYHTAKSRGITSIFTNQMSTSVREEIRISGVGISSLVDTAIILSYDKQKDRIHRNLLVLKSRGTNHSRKYHEFRITGNGIKVEYAANDE